MPPLIDTGWTFGRLILEVAEDAGLADQTGAVAAIPSDAATLDRVKRAVNKGYQEFIRHDPQWSFRARAFVITTNSSGASHDSVNGQTGVIRLPRWLQRAPDVPFYFVDENSVYSQLVPFTYAHVRSQQQRYPDEGVPSMYAVHPLESPDGMVGPGSGVAWALYLWPTPDAAYQIESQGFVYPYEMVELEERHIAGAEHDQTIKAFALKQLYSGPHEDPAKKRDCAEAAKEQLALSLAADMPQRVGIKGRLRDPRMLAAETRNPYAPGDSGGTLTAYGQVIG